MLLLWLFLGYMLVGISYLFHIDTQEAKATGESYWHHRCTLWEKFFVLAMFALVWPMVLLYNLTD